MVSGLSWILTPDVALDSYLCSSRSNTILVGRFEPIGDPVRGGRAVTSHILDVVQLTMESQSGQKENVYRFVEKVAFD